MNRRTFLGCLPVMAALPQDVIASAAAFAKAAEEKPEIKKKEIINVTTTCDMAMISYSDRTYEFVELDGLILEITGWPTKSGTRTPFAMLRRRGL